MGQNGPHQVNYSKQWEHQKHDHCKETYKLEWQFENTMKFDWKPVGLFENRRCPCLSVTVCDNPSKCVLNTLQLATVEYGQTPEERVAVNQGSYSPRY